MADAAQNNEVTPVVEKVAAEEVDAPAKEVAEEVTENGSASEATENGDAAAEAAESAPVAAADAADAAAGDAEDAADAPAKEAAAAEENGDEEAAKETNGDSTESAGAEAVKRKVAVEATDAKSDETATPEKKAKLDEATKEDVQNGADSEVAA